MGPGISGADDDTMGPDGGVVVIGAGLVTGAGLEAGAQATMRMPTTIVVATRDSEGRIRCPPDGVRLRRSAAPIVTPTCALR